MLGSTCPPGSTRFLGSMRLLCSTYRFLVSKHRLGSVRLLGSTPIHRFLISTRRLLGSTPSHRFPGSTFHFLGSTPTHRFLGSTHFVARTSPVEEKIAELEQVIKDMEMKIHDVEKKKEQVLPERRMKLKKEENFAYKCKAEEGQRISTFYVIDIDRPKRLQTTIELTKKKYNLSELCESLQPLDYEGYYEMGCLEPMVFLFNFKSHVQRASNASTCITPINYVDFNAILPGLSAPPFVIAVFDVAVVYTTVFEVAKKLGKKIRGEAPQHEIHEVLGQLETQLEVSSAEVDELVRKRFLIEQMKRSSLLKDYTIAAQAKYVGFPVSKYSTSKEDLVMYHKEFVKRGKVTGALFQAQDEDETAVEGVAGELKLDDPSETSRNQLIANMVKVAGNLAWLAVKNKHELFDKIKVYGLLTNCKDGSTHVATLLMDFKKATSTLEWCEEPQDFNSCIVRLSEVLSE